MICGTIGAGIDKLDISAFPVNEKAKVDIVGNDNFVTGENTIKVIVTSENSKMQKTYTLKLNKEESNSLIDVDEDGDIKNQNRSTESKGDSTFAIIWATLKENAVVILLYVFVWIEFLQVIYLYEKLQRFQNSEEIIEVNEKENINSNNLKNK